MTALAHTRIVTRRETYPVRGEATTIEAQVRVDTRTGEDIFDEKLDGDNLNRAFDAYRKKHDVPSPSEIAALREQYGLGQAAFALLLGWGEITLHRYEHGSLPTAAHATILKQCRDPLFMKRMLEENGHRLSKRQRAKLEQRLAQHQPDPLPNAILQRLAAAPSERNGYRPFSLDRFREAVLALADWSHGIMKTALCKQLWYLDFAAFRDLSVSLTGASYLRFDLGPVPERYQTLFEQLAEDGDLRVEEEETPKGVGFRFHATRKPDLSVFSAEELVVMKRVWTSLHQLTARKLVSRTHREPAWLNTPKNEVISYDYAETVHIDQ